MLDNKRWYSKWVLVGPLSRLGFAVIIVSLLSACASSVVVKSELPTPLVQKTPLTVSIRYTDEFRNYVYTEREKDRSLKNLDMTEAQIGMFNSIFSSLAELVPMTNTNRDLTIEPEFLDFQYTTPKETSLKMYEIWLKYRVKIFDQQDNNIADWVIKGYGKTPTSTFTNAGVAFNSATNIALRDVGAQLAISFAKQQRIQALIQQRDDDRGRAMQNDADLPEQIKMTEEAMDE